MTTQTLPPHWRIAETDAPLPPKAPGLPLLGNSLAMLRDPLRFLVQAYRANGPVFRVRMGFQDYTVLAGLEANQFLSRDATPYFSSDGLFGGMAEHVGSDTMLTVLEGEEHRYMRRLLRPGFARSAMEPHMHTVIGVVRDEVSGWQPGQMIPVLDTLRRLVADQLGLMTTGFPLDEYFGDVQHWLHTMLNVYAVKLQPKILLHRPSVRRSEARLREMASQIIAHHRAVPPGEARQRDAIDDILEATRPDGRAWTDNDLFNLATGPYFAGLDTAASSISFFLFALLRHDGVLERVQPEVDALLGAGAPALQAFRHAQALHAAAIEALRLYPIAPYTPRTARQTLEYGGYRIDAGSEVMFANTVTHMLNEYFPDPERFDIDRHLGGQAAPPPNALAPYSLGAHTCLGAGMAEMLMMVNIAALLHFAELELPAPDYQFTPTTLPLPNPGRGFRVRVRRLRI